jgi:hypothetical protein
MLPFAFQVTDAHTQYNYHHHHHPSSNRRAMQFWKIESQGRENEATHTYAVKRMILIIIYSHGKYVLFLFLLLIGQEKEFDKLFTVLNHKYQKMINSVYKKKIKL